MIRNSLFKRPVSLRFRLTLLIGLVTVGVLLSFGRYIEYTVEEHFVDQDAQELMMTVQSLQSVIENSDPDALLGNIKNILDIHHGVFAYIEDVQGRIVYAPDNILLSDLIVKQKQKSSWSSRPPLQTWQDNENMYRVYSAQIQREQGQSMTILTGMDIRFHQHYLQQFRKNLWLATFIACLIMICISWIVIKKGHQPLRKISLRIQNITSEHLNARLDTNAVPEELKGLVQSFNKMIGNIEEVFERQSHFSADIGGLLVAGEGSPDPLFPLTNCG